MLRALHYRQGILMLIYNNVRTIYCWKRSKLTENDHRVGTLYTHRVKKGNVQPKKRVCGACRWNLIPFFNFPSHVQIYLNNNNSTACDARRVLHIISYFACDRCFTSLSKGPPRWNVCWVVRCVSTTVATADVSRFTKRYGRLLLFFFYAINSNPISSVEKYACNIIHVYIAYGGHNMGIADVGKTFRRRAVVLCSACGPRNSLNKT